jgi:hypothetical protein
MHRSASGPRKTGHQTKSAKHFSCSARKNQIVRSDVPDYYFPPAGAFGFSFFGFRFSFWAR